MTTPTRRQVAQFVRPPLSWGPRDAAELLSFAAAAGAPAPVTRALQELPDRRYRSVDDLLADLPHVHREI